MSDFGDIFCDAGKKIARKTEKMTRIARVSLETESCKARLSALYEKLGKEMADHVLSEKAADRETAFKYMDEIRLERKRLEELCRMKKKLCDN